MEKQRKKILGKVAEIGQMLDRIGTDTPQSSIEIDLILEKIREIAALGIDFISVGSLTHSYSSLDISMEFLGEL